MRAETLVIAVITNALAFKLLVLFIVAFLFLVLDKYFPLEYPNIRWTLIRVSLFNDA